VPNPVEGSTNPIDSSFAGSDRSSRKPPSYYEAYENRKKSKSKRQLLKQNTKVIKVSILENNPDAMLKSSPNSSFFDNKSQEVPVKMELMLLPQLRH